MTLKWRVLLSSTAMQAASLFRLVLLDQAALNGDLSFFLPVLCMHLDTSTPGCPYRAPSTTRDYVGHGLNFIRSAWCVGNAGLQWECDLGILLLALRLQHSNHRLLHFGDCSLL
jgi:hypothetical protein